MISLFEKYKKEVAPEMIKNFGYKNILSVPRIEKVVINVGFGRLVSGKSGEEQKKIYQEISESLALIAGQKPVLRRAKKAISGFKTRKGMPLGLKVTLRRRRMYDFLERLINIALPRSRDFKGISLTSFDKKGNLNIGIKEHIVFPEILPEKSRIIFGLQITVITTAKTKQESIKMLSLLGFPIKK